MAYRSYSNETEVTVLGGLRVTIGYTIDPGDASVGMGASLDWAITEIAGRPLRKGEYTDWITKKLSKREIETIEQACVDAARQAEEDAMVDRAERERDYY